MSRATVSTIVSELIGDGLIHETQVTTAPGRVGRRGAMLTLDPASGATIGIDFDHECLRVMIVDRSFTVVAEAEHPLEMDHEADAVMSLAASSVRSAIAEAGIEGDRVLGVGIALAGPVDQVTRRAKPSSISPSWVEIDVASEMTALLGYPVHIDNDANLGALAELMFGAARGANDAVYVWDDTGIGAALIIDGQPYRGAVGTAGEIGHSTIDENGPVCRCGNRGCLERFVGRPGAPREPPRHPRRPLGRRLVAARVDRRRRMPSRDRRCRPASRRPDREPVQPRQPPTGDHRRLAERSR
jgi:predicted NBD/HSP70 family sugar kinase